MFTNVGGLWSAWKDRFPAADRPVVVRPSMTHLLSNATIPFDLARARKAVPALAAAHSGDGRPVLMIPGFMASDHRMEHMRRTLELAGYRAYGWGQGRNFGTKADSRERLDARIDEIINETGQPVTLVGWSLGGLFAREYAKYAATKVRAVVTLGSPFSGDPRANHAWRFYEMIARHSVDNPPFACVREQKPPVPTVALWSRRDGVIAPDAAAGRAGERDRAVEVDCTHMGFVGSPEGINAVCATLARL